MAARYKSDRYMTELEKSRIEDGCFVRKYVKEFDDAAISLFSAMIIICGAADSWTLLPEFLNKSSVTKYQLSEWLFSAIYLLHRYSIPLMSYAMKETTKLRTKKNYQVVTTGY